MSHPNNQHAARLREMARVRLPEHAVPLLAGAEALERQERDLAAIKAADAPLTEAMETISDLRGSLEVAKAALLKVRDHARPTHREDAYEVCYDWCPLCAVTAALARLEGE
jgi:hypothetical protein